MNREILLCFAILLCFSVTAANATQTASEWTTANQDEAYRIYKRIAAKLAEPAKAKRPKAVKIQLDCGGFSKGLMPNNQLQSSIAELADEVIRLERELKWYPKAIWRAELAAYEKAQLELIANDLSDAAWEKRRVSSERLKESLEFEIRRYRRKHPGSPKVELPLLCAVLPPPYLSFKTDAAIIRYISVHAYEFCRERNIHLDFASCDEWTNYAFKPTRVGWGRVHFYFSWKDGLFREMTIDVSSLARKNTTRGASVELEVQR